jgi:carbamoyl-phosphate synthase large subunit
LIKILIKLGLGNVLIWGTHPQDVDRAENRELWYQILNKLKIMQPPGGLAHTEEEAYKSVEKLGFPVILRPSYVLGGRAMEIVRSKAELRRYVKTAMEVELGKTLLIDKYLDHATELDVDALADKEGTVVIAGIMEHIEQAGVHSGDSACSIPVQTIPDSALSNIIDCTERIAKELNIVGLINIQFCVQDGRVYILEANPRASRTVPFVAKARGLPFAKYASMLMAGNTIRDICPKWELSPRYTSVKEVVLPFEKFQGCDVLLGPEMRSTGEVMGIDSDFPLAFLKAQLAAGQKLPRPAQGAVYISVKDLDKADIVPIARELDIMGYIIVASLGTGEVLRRCSVNCQTTLKVHEGRPNIADMLKNNQIALVIISSDQSSYGLDDGLTLRRLAISSRIPIITTTAGATAAISAIRCIEQRIDNISLQAYFSTEAV